MPQILQAQQHGRHPLKLAVKMDLVVAETRRLVTARSGCQVSDFWSRSRATSAARFSIAIATAFGRHTLLGRTVRSCSRIRSCSSSRGGPDERPGPPRAGVMQLVRCIEPDRGAIREDRPAKIAQRRPRLHPTVCSYLQMSSSAKDAGSLVADISPCPTFGRLWPL